MHACAFVPVAAAAFKAFNYANDTSNCNAALRCTVTLRESEYSAHFTPALKPNNKR